MQNSTISSESRQAVSKLTSSRSVPENLSDQELYKKCQLYGGEVRKWARRFAVLLPEVARRELYKKYGFYSIFDFAAKLAGMKHETVVDILRVVQKLEDKPLLRAQMETAGWGKLKVIATIATKENEKMLAEKVATMSLATLQTFVQELKKREATDAQMAVAQHFGENVQIRIDSAENGTMQEIKPEQSNLLQTAQGANSGSAENGTMQIQAVPNRIFVRLLLAPKNELKLKELQRKFSREQKAPVDLNEVVEILLDAYERQQMPVAKKRSEQPQSAVQKKQKLTTSASVIANLRFAIQQKVSSCTCAKQPSRHTPTKTKKILHQKFVGRCAWPGCLKLPDFFHHTLRFSLNPSHDPDHITPLCKNHERLAHHGLIENEEKPSETWRLITEPDKSALKYKIDQKVIAHYAPQNS